MARASNGPRDRACAPAAQVKSGPSLLGGATALCVLLACAHVLGLAGAAQAQPGANGAPPAAVQPASDRLSGHGGPVKGVAVYYDATSGGAVRPMALTASFDNKIGFWDVQSGQRVLKLEGHEAAVNAVAFTPNGAAALSGSDDFSVRYWSIQSGLSFRLDGHKGKVAHVAVSPDGKIGASASWDGSIGLWSLPQNRQERPASLGFLPGHRGGVSAVMFAPDSRTLLSGGADGAVRRWRVADQALIRTEVKHGFNIWVLAQPADGGWFAYGAADGVVRVLETSTGRELAALTGERQPIVSLALSPSGARLAYGDGDGFITTVKTDGWATELEFRAAARGMIWGLAWADEQRLLAAGLDSSVAIWPITGAAPPKLLAKTLARFHVDPATVSNGERQFARKCSVCHSLNPSHEERAGPSLYGLFGRKIGAAAGYAYSPQLAAMDIVWSEETVDKLFELGPDVFTPGSKMPVQRITGAKDRADLIAYLKAATARAENEARPKPK